MIREIFLSRNPSHFTVNELVKAYIISESFLWGAINFIAPIFAIYTITLPGGNIQLAGAAFSVNIIARVIFELIGGRYFGNAKEQSKLVAIILGMLFIGASFAALGVFQTIPYVFFFYALCGAGLGLISPIKSTIFALHLDHNKEILEWGVQDAMVFTSIALCGALGGFIAEAYGFQWLFFIASFVTVLAVIPYLLYLKKIEH